MSSETLEDTVEIQVEGSPIKIITVEGFIRKVFGHSSRRVNIRNFPYHSTGFQEPADKDLERYLNIFLEGSRFFVFRGDPPLEEGHYIRAGITIDLGNRTKAIYIQRLGNGLEGVRRTDFMTGYNPSSSEADRLGILD